jgi:hypothetical protein
VSWPDHVYEEASEGGTTLAGSGDRTSVTPEESAGPTEPLSRAEMARRLGSPSGRLDAVTVLPRPSRPLTDEGKFASAVREKSPQADVVRLIADLQQVGGEWKISDVTVLEGATPASAGSPSGSTGSSVPGQ